MGVLPIDIELYLSGGVANRDGNAALGGIMSAHRVLPNFMQGLFHDLDTAVIGAGAGSHYRCIYVYNRHPTDTLTACTVFISQVYQCIDILAGPTLGAPINSNLVINIGADLAGVGGIAAVVANELTAPAGPVVFVAPVTYGTGLNLGNIPPGSWAPLWLKLDWLAVSIPPITNRIPSPDHYFRLSFESTVP